MTPHRVSCAWRPEKLIQFTRRTLGDSHVYNHLEQNALTGFPSIELPSSEMMMRICASLACVSSADTWLVCAVSEGQGARPMLPR
jgi:hypothetical protein